MIREITILDVPALADIAIAFWQILIVINFT